MASKIAGKPKSRIKNLSTRFLNLYKYGTAGIIAAFVLGILYYEYQSYVEDNEGLFHFIMPLTYGHLIWIWIGVNRNVYQVEFDDEFLYVIQKNQDILIPLENIKEVEIVSLGGVYKVTLYSKDQLGHLIYFKPSLLYPFNFKTKDKLVDVLRHSIEEAKKKVRFYPQECVAKLKF